jgi:hypothetical protein
MKPAHQFYAITGGGCCDENWPDLSQNASNTTTQDAFERTDQAADRFHRFVSPEGGVKVSDSLLIVGQRAWKFHPSFSYHLTLGQHLFSQIDVESPLTGVPASCLCLCHQCASCPYSACGSLP